MHDFAQIEGDIGDEMGGGEHLQYRQGCNRRQCVGLQFQGRRAGPAALHHDVAEMVPCGLAEARARRSWWVKRFSLSRQFGFGA